MTARALAALAALIVAAGPLEAQEPVGRVVVRNLLDQDLLIWINGEPRGLAEARGEAVFDGIPPGSLSLLASGSGAQGIVASEKRGFAPGATFRWTLYPIPVYGEEKGSTVLVVRNQLDAAIELELAGNPAGQIEPGGARTYARIAAGDVTARVRYAAGRVLYDFPLTLIPDETMVWEIGPEPTRPTPIPRPPLSTRPPVD